MTIWAIVPVKPLRLGKSRLAGFLSEDQRTRLNHYMLQHVLTTLSLVIEVNHTLVVSRDPAALALTREMGGRTVLEDGAPQFNIAIQRATIAAIRQGAHAVLILPADLPLIKPEDISKVIKIGKKPPVVVISPDRRNDGTNALFINPAGLIEYGYGPGSFQIHSLRAEEKDATLRVIRSKRIGLDLDLPDDLEALGGLKALGLE